eukprot:3690590-Pleurochrysis_carterae.AAC.1
MIASTLERFAAAALSTTFKLPCAVFGAMCWLAARRVRKFDVKARLTCRASSKVMTRSCTCALRLANGNWMSAAFPLSGAF